MTELPQDQDAELEAGLLLVADLRHRNPIAAVALCRTLLNGQLVRLERRNMQAVRMADRIDALLDGAPESIKTRMHSIGRLGIGRPPSAEAIEQAIEDLKAIAQWQAQSQKLARLLALADAAVEPSAQATPSGDGNATGENGSH